MTATVNRTEERAAAEPAAAEVRVAVVDPTAGEDAAYTMFELLNLTENGAFLSGSLFFEVDEEFSLALSIGDERPILTRVRVVRLVRGAVSGMEVVFADLSDSDRAAVTAMVARSGE